VHFDPQACRAKFWSAANRQPTTSQGKRGGAVSGAQKLRRPAAARGGAEESFGLVVVGAEVLCDVLGHISNALGLAGNVVPWQILNLKMRGQLPPACREVCGITDLNRPSSQQDNPSGISLGPVIH
jgi:hypothetical protein